MVTAFEDARQSRTDRFQKCRTLFVRRPTAVENARHDVFVPLDMDLSPDVFGPFDLAGDSGRRGFVGAHNRGERGGKFLLWA